MAHLNLDPADLESLALELGAPLHRPDGTVFNAGAFTGSRRVAYKPPVVAAPLVTPPASPDNTNVLEKIVELLARPQQSAPEINIPAPVVTVQPAQRVLDWTFTFERNPDGSIKSIRAKAA